jgi:glycosyltransferase involved in cell wall biosynthesis
MKLIIIIPAYNEEKFIGNVIKNIIQIKNDLLKKFFDKIILLVINDGSTDSTIEIAKKSGANEIISHKKNEGLGYTFKTGIENALELGADIIVTIDADGQFNPEDIPKLIIPIINEEADMVTCTRFANKPPKMPLSKKFGNKRFTKLVNRLTKSNFTDTQCGFRAYSREAALHLTLFGRYTYTQEVFLDLVIKGLKIIEVPCNVKGEREGKSRLIKSIPSYGINSLMILFRAYRDSQPLRFFGSIGALLFIPGVIIALILAIRLILIHQIYPFMSLAWVSLAMIIIGVLLFVLALVADMYVRQRKLQEEILYRLKKSNYKFK